MSHSWDIPSIIIQHLPLSPLRLRRCQPNLRPALRAKRQSNTLPPRAGLATLQRLKLLAQPTCHIRRLSKRILLSETDSRSSIEGQVLPPRTKRLPAFGPELIEILAVVIGAAVHGVSGVGYHGAFLNEDWGLAVGSAAEGKNGVDGCEARVYRDYGVETESWVGLGFSLTIFQRD